MIDDAVSAVKFLFRGKQLTQAARVDLRAQPCLAASFESPSWPGVQAHSTVVETLYLFIVTQRQG